MTPFRLLFVGNAVPFQTTAARLDAFRELGLSVELVDERALFDTGSRVRRTLTLWTRLTPQVFAFNRAILAAARDFRPDVIWIEKGVNVFPRTMRTLRREHGGAVLAYHNTDDWRGRTQVLRFKWRFLFRALRLYDVHVTSNLHNVREMREAGLPRVHHMELAANPALSATTPISEEDRRRFAAPVGFIGHWEEATERLLVHLLRGGVRLKIFGANWEKAEAREELSGACTYDFVWGDDYSRAVRCFDINLGIVSAQNRSHTATRTFQVPALGAFLLHERNELVTKYYREGEEAEFFSSADELLEKCRYYLAHPDERRRIADAGRRRCEESGYFETDRVRDVLPVFEDALRDCRAARASR